MKSDQEILRLFADANPRPPRRASQTLTQHDLPAIEKKTRNMQDLPTAPLQNIPPPWGKTRIGLVMAAVLAGLIFTGLWVSELPPRNPTINQSPVTTPSTTNIPPDPVDMAVRFLAARNAFDAGEVTRLIGSGSLTLLRNLIEPTEVAAYVDWLAMYDWKINSPRCEQTGPPGTVECAYTLSDRLIPQGAFEVAGTITFVTSADRIVRVDDDFDTDTYAPTYFEPFVVWVSENYPESVDVMWDFSGAAVAPNYNDQALRLFDEHLTEYTDPVGVAQRYLTLRNSFDSQALAAIVGPGNFRASGRVLRQAELPFYFDWLKIFDWQLADPDCEPAGLDSVTCSYSLTNRLTRHEGINKLGTTTIKVEAGRVSATDDPFDVKTYDQDFFAPFYSWVRQNHPDSFDTMWLEFGGEATPRYSADSLLLFEELLTEYTGSP